VQRREIQDQELRQSVTQADFAELKAVVADLAEAQSRTEQRVQELAEAQNRTEERLSRLEQVVSNLVEAQSRTEQRVRELAEAQSRGEERLSRLEQVVSKLAEAQQRTELEVRALTRGLKATRERVAGLSNSVGYGLENRAIARLPALLEAEHGVRVQGRLVRRFVQYPEGGEDEVNIFGEGRKGEWRVSIVGEAKMHLAKRHIDEF
jgi:septal ring factor EnvC (AmiA/AmiB activator)